MENLSPLNGPHRSAVAIPNPSWLQDHRFMGSAVLPGVWALECLARTVAQSFADMAVTSLEVVRFDKLLALPAPATPYIDALVEFAAAPAGGVQASLLTRHAAGQSGIRRLKVHARAIFTMASGTVDGGCPPSWRFTPPVDAFQVPVDRLYEELVPFGAAFRNVISSVQLWADGALAIVSGGPTDEDPSMVLGSPFPLDAAFHAACVWSQRYHGLVAFPVAMARRRVCRPTRSEEAYEAAVLFREAERSGLCFDLQLRDREGRLCEAVQGLVMRDISGGRLRPPGWMMKNGSEKPT